MAGIMHCFQKLLSCGLMIMHGRKTGVFALSIIILGLLGQNVAAQVVLAASQPRLATHKVDLARGDIPVHRACQFNRVSISPSGEWAIVWRDYQTGFADAPLDFVPADLVLADLRKTKSSVLSYRSEGPISAVRWSADTDAVEVALFRRSVWRMHPNNADVPAYIGQLPSAWSRVDFRFQSHGPLLEALNRPDWIDQVTRVARDRRYRYLNAFIDQDMALFGADTEQDFVVVRFDDLSTGLSAFGLNDVSAPSGVLADVDAGGTDQAHSGTAYRRPHLDLATGRQIGFLTPWRVSTAAVGGILASEGLIKAASTSHDTTVALLSNSTGSHRLLVARGVDDMHAIHLCSGVPEDQTDRIPERQYQSVPFPGKDNGVHFVGLWTMLDMPPDERALIIRFHGGPLASVFGVFPDASTRQLGRLGMDVLDIDYPGSSGLGAATATALASTGAEAINDSVRRIMAWVETQRYDRVYVIGESFGAIFAHEVAKAFPDKVERLFLLAPFTRLSMENGIGGSPLPDKPTAPQVALERYTFGSRAQRQALSEWMAEAFDPPCTTVPTTVFYGDADRVPDREHMASSCLQGADIVEIPNLTHQSLFTDEGMWSQMAALLEPSSDETTRR